MKLLHRCCLRAASLLATVAVAGSATLSPPKVERKIVAPASDRPSLVVSPTGVHVAALAMKGSRSFVVVDGQEGPEIDELLASTGDPSLTCVNAVLFSADGKTYAYAARRGDRFIVVRNGKEIYQAPFENRAMAGGTGQLTVSPMGKHVSFLEKVDVPPSEHAWRLVVDGKPGPLSSNNNSFQLIFSPDDSRWAYVAAKFNGKRDEQFTVVDGKEVPHLGHYLRFTGDNKLVTLASSEDGLWTLLVEGKVRAKGITNAESKVWVSRVGSLIAAAIRKPDAQKALWVDGKEVSAAAGAKDIDDVAFSPDGKRYIAVCQTVAAHFAVVDGKKGREYRLISLPQFTRDSSKALYVATSGSKNFVIVDGEESDGFEILGGQYVKIAMPKKGPRFAYSTGDGMNRVFSVVADAKPVPLVNKAPAHDSLAFSADGTSYAFAAAPVGRSEIDTLLVNGEEVPDFYPHLIVLGAPNTAQREAFYVLSADGKHYAAAGMNKTKSRRGLYLDNKLIYATERGVFRAAFTPDGKHLFWATQVPGESSPVPSWVLLVDGVQAVKLPSPALEGIWGWEMTDDGVYQFVAREADGITRYEVTPANDTNIEMAAANFAAAEAQALADAEAAKQKAADEAAAAKQAKAEADAAAAAKAKADREAAQAKRKADAEAKAKARRDALEARKKAQQR